MRVVNISEKYIMKITYPWNRLDEFDDELEQFTAQQKLPPGISAAARLSVVANPSCKEKWNAIVRVIIWPNDNYVIIPTQVNQYLS